MRKVVQAKSAGGFSLIEVALALGVASFALITIAALLSVGMITNQISTEEMHASDILSVLSADLRNTDPRLNSGKSLFFGLELPYAVSGSQVTFNTITAASPPTLTVPSACSVGLDNFESLVTGTTSRRSYQASVIYTVVPAAGTGATAVVTPIHAHLIVNWPALKTTATISDLTDMTKVKGYVEAYVTFPAP